MKYRKIKRKWKNISKNKKMMILFVMILSIITVGYASLNQVLNITGYASIDKGDGMIFTSIGIKENNGAIVEQDASIKAKTLVNTQVSFQSAGSITFQVSAQNQGTTDAKLIEIRGLEKSNIKEPTCIQVSVQDHNVGELVYPKQIKNFTITITSTCSTYSSKELDLHFIYEKQETINGVLPYKTIGEHTSELLTNSTDGTYNYMDGTYLKGNQDSNYVWFDGFLWRIMGKNSDGSIRMITEENVTAIPWGAENTAQDYDNSYINDWLNNYFYPKLKDKKLLVNQTWCSEMTKDISSKRTTCTNNSSKIHQTIGLLSLDEYNLASGYDSYLITSQIYWTITPVSTSNLWEVKPEGVDSEDKDNLVQYRRGVRPIVGISSDVIITGGQGILTDPYMVENTIDVTGSLKDHSLIGEYVTYAGRNYRVVETSETGTKLILDGYYDNNNDGIIENSDKMIYGENCTICTFINEEVFVNWISNNNELDKNKLVETTWYREGFFDHGDYYKDHLEGTNNPYVGKVGLIQVGEMLSSQSETIISKNHTTDNSFENTQDFWTINSGLVWTVLRANLVVRAGHTGDNRADVTYAIRPVINIGPNVQILGGNGTFNEPFQI